MGTSGRGEGGTVWASSPPGAVGGGTEGESCGGPVAHLLGELSLKRHNEKLTLLYIHSCLVRYMFGYSSFFTSLCSMHIFAFSQGQFDHYSLCFGIAGAGLESSLQHASLCIPFLEVDWFIANRFI